MQHSIPYRQSTTFNCDASIIGCLCSKLICLAYSAPNEVPQFAMRWPYRSLNAILMCFYLQNGAAPRLSPIIDLTPEFSALSSWLVEWDVMFSDRRELTSGDDFIWFDLDTEKRKLQHSYLKTNCNRSLLLADFLGNKPQMRAFQTKPSQSATII